jgi:hypothetical protein
MKGGDGGYLMDTNGSMDMYANNSRSTAPDTEMP